MTPRPRPLDDARRLRWLRRALVAALAASLLAEAFAALHPHFAVDAVFGFHAVYGFGAGAALIALARLVAAALQRADGHYGRPPAEAAAARGGVERLPPDPSPDDDD